MVLLDIKLPDVDGMEIPRIVRDEKPTVYVIVITDYSAAKNAVETMKLGAIDSVPKPFTDHELVLSVSRG